MSVLLVIGVMGLIPAAPQVPYELVVCPAGEGNARNSEASVVELRDGRLLLAWSRYGPRGDDHDWAQISGKISEDRGRSWGPEFTIVPNDAGMNLMDVTLLRLQSGALGLFYLRKNSTSDCRLRMRKSYDEGQTWTEEVLCIPSPGYYCVNNDRVIQLSSGRLLAPASYTPDVATTYHFTSYCCYSDDEGETWQEGRGKVDLPKSGADEPGVAELKDGRVLMVIRCELGHVYKAYSSDGGDTWSQPQPTPLQSPSAPATIKRIPSTGDLLIVWNNSPHDPDRGIVGRRTPLTTAISRDEGATWECLRDLDTDAAHQAAYASLLFLGGEALITYFIYDWPPGSGMISLKERIVPIGWFYGE